MKKWGSIGNRLLPTSFLVLLIILWEAAINLMQVPDYKLPAPSSILTALINNFPLLLQHSKTTLYEAAIGLVVAIIIALFLAIVVDSFNFLKRIIYPLLVISQSVPIIALAPIILILFGLGILPKILIVALVCFFPLALNLIEGLENVNREQIDLLKIMKADSWTIFKMVQLPSVLPYFFAGLKISATYSVMGAIIGEWLGASSGLGIYMTRAMHSFKYANLFSAIIIVVLLSISFFKLTEFLAWLTMPWKRKFENQ
ncbi:MAG: ABC transporter permease [Bacillota bacterium]|nr:ABC transporter permease [Bacillota bacterium]